VFLFGKGNYMSNPIHGKDLARICVEAFNSNQKELPAGGPNVYSYKEIAEMAFKVLNKKNKIMFIPIWIRDIVLFLIRKLTTSKTYGPIEFLLTILTMDLIAPRYGTQDLLEFFKSQVQSNNK